MTLTLALELGQWLLGTALVALPILFATPLKQPKADKLEDLFDRRTRTR